MNCKLSSNCQKYVKYFNPRNNMGTNTLARWIFGLIPYDRTGRNNDRWDGWK